METVRFAEDLRFVFMFRWNKSLALCTYTFLFGNSESYTKWTFSLIDENVRKHTAAGFEMTDPEIQIRSDELVVQLSTSYHCMFEKMFGENLVQFVYVTRRRVLRAINAIPYKWDGWFFLAQ